MSDELTVVAHDLAGAGGMESQLRDLVEGLLDRGVRVTVVARSCALAPRPGLRVVRVRGPARPFLVAYPWFLVAGSVALRRHRRGLVHAVGAIVLGRVDVVAVHLCHHGIAAKASVLRSRRATRTYRAHAHLAAALARLGERLLLRPATVRAVAAVSADVADEVRTHLPRIADRVRVVPNGVDVERFRPAVPAPAVDDRLGPQAVFVGGEWEGKGLRHALEGAALAGWRLLVVGEGDRDRFRALARRLGSEDRVAFAGRLDDVAPAYAGAQAFVLPSAYETFSLAAHEAAACGLPLVVTRVGGVRELVEPGVNGWFVDRDGADVARRLRELAADPERRRRMTEAARRSALAFDRPRMVEAHLALLRELERAR